jgi:hypothetical protein
MSNLKKILFILSLFTTFTISAQSPYYNDAQVWLAVDVNKELNDHFDLRLKMQGRMTDNASEFGRGYIDIGATYRIRKEIRVFGDYVYGQKRKNNDTWQSRHVIFAGLILRKEIQRWRFTYRNMFQARYEAPGVGQAASLGYYFDRNKIDIRYDINKRLAAYVAGEVNIPLNHPNVRGIAISRTRTYLGTVIVLSKHHALDLYFMYQAKLMQGDWFDQDDDYPNKPLKRFYVYGITYKIDF